MGKKTKIFITIFIIFIITIIFRISITTKKETENKTGSKIELEIKSETVQKVYAKLDSLDYSVLYDDNYRYAYFENPNKEKILTNDEKLYLAFESLYKSNKFDIEIIQSDIELLKIDKSLVKEKLKNTFKDSDFELDKIDYRISKNCGIIDYLSTETDYLLKYQKCDRSKKISKSKLISAFKEGNYIDLKIKAYYLLADTKKKNFYQIKNFNDEKILGSKSIDYINKNLDTIFDNYEIKEYTFSFELINDDYYLVKIIQEKNHS